MNNYNSSNRKKLRDLLNKINSETGLSMSALSIGIGYKTDYLNHASSENELRRNGDIRESTLNDLVAKLSNKHTIFMLRYKKSRCFEVKQCTSVAAKELNVSEGKISLLVSSFLLGANKATTHYLSNKMAKSQFSLKGDLDVNEFNTLIRAIEKVIEESKLKAKKVDTNITIDTSSDPFDGLELITQQSFSSTPKETSLVHKHSEFKKPTLLNQEQIAEKLKQYMGYSSALWVDGHLVLSGSLGG